MDQQQNPPRPFARCRSQTEIYPLQSRSLEMPQKPLSRPPPVLDEISGHMGARLLSSTVGRAQFRSAPALDKKAVFTRTYSLPNLAAEATCLFCFPDITASI